MLQPALTHSDPPAVGQIVNVRSRRFVVADVAASSALDPSPSGRSTLVTLSSVEDDAHGEELQVVWELEPGAAIMERASMPEVQGLDDPARLDGFLNAVRWGAISQADVSALQAPFRSGIDIEDYQLDPLARAIRMPRVNLLIADDVGLGKTVESGLVIQELMLRHRVRSALVVCPSSIQIQWRDQMRDKFGLDFRIVDSELMKSLRRSRGLHVNPWTHFPRLITSIDFLKRERPLRLFQEVLPAPGEAAFPRRFDMLVVDEAHNIAPSGSGRYATDSQRTHAIRMLSQHFEHKLFLSATPHNGYPESFTALLELLDNQRFARSIRPHPEQLAAVMVRRLKRELPPRWDGSPRYPQRVIEPLEVTYSDAERQAHRNLAEYARLRADNAAGGAERFASEFVLKLLKKRLLSSPQAFLTTLERHLESLRRAQPRAASARAPTQGVLQRQVEGLDDDADDDEAFEQQTLDAVDSAAPLLRPLGGDEERLLAELLAWARAAAARPDAKAERLLAWLEAEVRPAGTWTDTRVILFTEYRTTQKWLQGLLATRGYGGQGGERLMVLYGGMDSDEREKIKAAFQADPAISPVRILLATDAASEGIDLQNHCSRLVHLEIPWNPNRMEQRNGRVDRHGQKAARVLIHHFAPSGFADHAAANRQRAAGDLEGDLEFLMRAVRKVETIREDLGKVGPVIAAQVAEAMLGRRQQLDTDRAERDAAPARGLLRVERNLQEQLRRLFDQLQESRRTLHLEPQAVREVVRFGLELAGQPPLEPVRIHGLGRSGGAAGVEPLAFRVPHLSGAWLAATDGLAHPHTHQVRPVVFDHALVAGRDDVVLLHLNHRLVQMCLQLLRGEVWSRGATRRLHRATARTVPDTLAANPMLIGHARLVVLGGDNQRLHEEVIFAGLELREGRAVRVDRIGRVQELLAGATLHAAPKPVADKLRTQWPMQRDNLERALDARMKERTETLQSRLDERAKADIASMNAALAELMQSIRSQLADATPQLELFSTPEREQFERDRGALERRLAELPAEIEREAERISARYAAPKPRLFPVAVTWLVPDRLARNA